jgi:hypothetical protein
LAVSANLWLLTRSMRQNNQLVDYIFDVTPLSNLRRALVG